MRKRLAVASFLVIALIVLMIYVSNSRRKGEGEKVNIGSVLILTGDFSSYGEQFRDGALLAAEEINSHLAGSEPRANLTFVDSRGEKERAKELVRTLYERDDIHYLADVMGSGLAVETAPEYNRLRMLVLSGVNTSPDLSLKGGEYFFRIIPSDGAASVQLSKWAKSKGYVRAAIVHDVDEWANNLIPELKSSFSSVGGDIVSEVDCAKGHQLFGPLVAKVRSTNPQVVFLLVYPREAGLFIREAARQGFSPAFMGTDNFTGAELVEHAGGSAVGVMFVVPGTTSANENPELKKLRVEYARKYPGRGEPSLFTITGYDVVNILYDAAKRFQDDTPAAVAYLKASSFKGASGSISFDENGDVKVADYQRIEYKLVNGEVKAVVEP